LFKIIVLEIVLCKVKKILLSGFEKSEKFSLSGKTIFKKPLNREISEKVFQKKKVYFLTY